MTEQFHDLKFDRLDDGTVRLTQRDCAGDEYIMDAHPVQILHIARTLKGSASKGTASPWPVGFQRRMKRIHLQLSGLVDTLASVPCFPPQEYPTEDVKEAQALLDAFEDFLTDFGFIQESEQPQADEGAGQ